jgi:hypothetical protein
MKKIGFCLFFLLAYYLSFAEDLTVKPTTIVGFLNTGKNAENNFNIVIIRSLLTFFSQLPDTRVTPYEDLAKRASGFWRNTKLNLDEAVQIAQYFESKQMIAGDYSVDKKRNKITIHVIVYDVVTGELKLERTYQSTGKMGIFNTIDDMAQNLSGLMAGRELNVGAVLVKFQNIKRPYDLFINSKLVSKISNQTVFQARLFASEPIELSIRYSDSGKEALRKRFTLKKDEIASFDFMPSGKMIVKNMIRTAQGYLDGQDMGTIEKDREFIGSLSASTNHTLTLTSFFKDIVVTNVNVEEGEERVLVLLTEQNPPPVTNRGVDYTGKEPLWDLLVPGLVQFQANDNWMGGLFLAGGAAGVGLTAFSITGLSIASCRYNTAPDAETAVRYKSYVEDWTLLLCGSAVLWLGSAGLSAFHAATQKKSKAFQAGLPHFYCGKSRLFCRLRKIARLYLIHF